MWTVEKVREAVDQQARNIWGENHGTSLIDLLVRPEEITVIERSVHNGAIEDRLLKVWLVAQESTVDGYRIVMSSDGSEFGLASSGWRDDQHLVLCGWYGDLESTFLGM
jgi:hypothetical protein